MSTVISLMSQLFLLEEEYSSPKTVLRFAKAPKSAKIKEFHMTVTIFHQKTQYKLEFSTKYCTHRPCPKWHPKHWYSYESALSHRNVALTIGKKSAAEIPSLRVHIDHKSTFLKPKRTNWTPCDLLDFTITCTWQPL